MRRIGLCCWEKACGSHGHAIDDDKRLPVRNDRVQPHSAHALRVSAFAKGATQRIDLEHRLQHARRVAKSTTQPLSDGRSARMSKRSVGRGGEEKGRGLIQAGEGCEARTDGGERLPIQELHCFAVATIVGLQLANCRMQIAREASSSVCRIFEGRGARGGSGGGHCVLSCGLPCRAEASLQIPDCKYRLQHAAERGAAGLGGESADLRLPAADLAGICRVKSAGSHLSCSKSNDSLSADCRFSFSSAITDGICKVPYMACSSQASVHEAQILQVVSTMYVP
jgi:hypothetical protein